MRTLIPNQRNKEVIMKRLFAFLLCLVMVLSLLPACGSGEGSANTTGKPAPTESPEEAEVLKIMILGSSRSINTFQMLWNAFKDQMPDQKVVLGVMYRQAHYSSQIPHARKCCSRCNT